MSYHEAELGRMAEAPQKQASAGARPNEPWEREADPCFQIHQPYPQLCPSVDRDSGWGDRENKQECLGKKPTVDPTPPPGCSPLPGLSAHESLQLAPFPSASPIPIPEHR